MEAYGPRTMLWDINMRESLQSMQRFAMAECSSRCTSEKLGEAENFTSRSRLPTVFRVHYKSASALREEEFDFSGGFGKVVLVMQLNEAGFAAQEGVCTGYELIAVAGRADFRAGDPCRLIESLCCPTTLVFSAQTSVSAYAQKTASCFNEAGPPIGLPAQINIIGPQSRLCEHVIFQREASLWVQGQASEEESFEGDPDLSNNHQEVEIRPWIYELQQHEAKQILLDAVSSPIYLGESPRKPDGDDNKVLDEDMVKLGLLVLPLDG